MSELLILELRHKKKNSNYVMNQILIDKQLILTECDGCAASMTEMSTYHPCIIDRDNSNFWTF